MNHPFHPVADGDGECAICHNGIGSTVHAEGREGVDRMSTKTLPFQLRVHYDYQKRGYGQAATRDHVLAAVRELGGVEVQWCDTHGQRGNFYAGCYHRDGCVTRPFLIVSLDTGDPE
jgi:hypothetical protein